MSFNRYSLSTKEYYDQGVITLSEYLKNVKPEFIKSEIERFLKKVEEYDLEKKQYDSLTDEEKIKLEIIEFQQNLRKEIIEISNIRFVLMHGKTHDDSNEYEYDPDYIKTLTIVSDFERKRKYFEKILKEKIASLRFDPPISSDKENELVSRMIINEFGRLNNNLISYNYFLSFLSSYYKNDNMEKLSNFNSFKINTLMFLLDVDYEKNVSMYENYSFPDISISIIENHIKRDGREDDFTVKVKEKKYAKILRDAASHGEFYPNDQRNNFAHMNFDIHNEELLSESSIVRIENSKGIPRIGINLQYGILHKFVMDNLSDNTKLKYDFLVKIIEANSYQDVIENSSSKDFQQMIILMLNNIIQYNIEHHFKETESEIDNLDLAGFSIYDENNNGIDITANLTNKDKLMNIKNAIGHDNITWNEDELILINDWTPSNPNRDTRAPIKRKIVCNRQQLIEFLLQSDLYNFAISNQVDNSIMNRSFK